MADLDFSELSDDQIVELATALAREAMRRNPALSAAFERAMLDEAERIAAAARGQEQARHGARDRAEAEARRAQRVIEKAAEEQRRRDALAHYLKEGARIAGREIGDVSMVWAPGERFRSSGGPRVMLNHGTSGEEASWHLCKFVERTQMLHTSPALKPKAAELQAWAREVIAAMAAFGIDRTTVVKGIEL